MKIQIQRTSKKDPRKTLFKQNKNLMIDHMDEIENGGAITNGKLISINKKTGRNFDFVRF